MAADLKVFGLNCSLKSSKAKESSSTDVLLRQVFDALAEHGAAGEFVRAADYNIKPGVKSDEGDGDDWPDLLRQVLAADILVIGAPIWLGQPSSIAKRVMERMDAFIDEKDGRGRMPSYGKVVIAAIVGNEDGAHHSIAEILSGADRSRLQRAGRRRNLLGRRGHGLKGIQGIQEAARGDRQVE